jgi:hypothetical protein
MEWNSEDQGMPRALWYRQVATQNGRPLAGVRERLQHLDPPKAVKTDETRTTKGFSVKLNG